MILAVVALNARCPIVIQSPLQFNIKNLHKKGNECEPWF